VKYIFWLFFWVVMVPMFLFFIGVPLYLVALDSFNGYC
jgi:hypothetical protein